MSAAALVPLPVVVPEAGRHAGSGVSSGEAAGLPVKLPMIRTPEEEALQKERIEIQCKDEEGEVCKKRKVVDEHDMPAVELSGTEEAAGHREKRRRRQRQQDCADDDDDTDSDTDASTDTMADTGAARSDARANESAAAAPQKKNTWRWPWN